MAEPLTITTNPRDDRQLDLTIQVGPERTEQAVQRAARQVAKRVNIPGFRRGKAPIGTVVRTVGRDAVLSEILDDLGQELYQEVLESEKLEPYGQAALVDVEMDPLTFKLLVPLPPEVELNDYRSIQVEETEVNVTEEDVDAVIEQQRSERSTLQEVERPAETGDTVVIDIRGTVGEDTIMDNTDWELQLQEETGWLPGFADAFVGLSAGDEKTFTLTYPEDSASRYKGQEATFSATMKLVKARVQPELDDEFAKSLGDFETVADLRAKLRENLTEERTTAAEAELNDKAVDALVEKATLAYPPALVEEALHEMLDDLARRVSNVGYSLEDFLRLQGTTLQDYHDRLRPQAESRAKARLVLSKLTEVEQVDATDEEILAEIERMAGTAGDEEQQKSVRDLFGSEQGKQYVRQDLLSRKTLARLRAIVTGKELESPETAPEATKEAQEGEEESTAEASADA